MAEQLYAGLLQMTRLHAAAPAAAAAAAGDAAAAVSPA